MAEVVDLADADRLARKLARIKAKRARQAAEYKAAAAKADDRLAKWEKYAEERLQRHLARAIEADEDGDPMAPQTLELPCGVKLNYRPNPVGKRRLVIKDEQALIAWCMDTDEGEAADRHYGLVVESPAIQKDKLREALEDNIPIEGAYLADPDWSVYSLTIPKALLATEAEDEADGL